MKVNTKNDIEMEIPSELKDSNDIGNEKVSKQIFAYQNVWGYEFD